MILKLTALLFALPIALFGCVRSFGQPTRSDFLALGDSYTIGEGVSPADRWPVQLTNLFKREGIDLGQPTIIARTGWRTDQLKDAIESSGVKGPYKLVSLLIGVNNQFQGRDEQEYRQQFVELLSIAIALAGGEKSRVIVLSIPDWSVTPKAENYNRPKVAKEIDRFNDINQQEARRAGVAYIDITAISRQAATQTDLIAPDGLHPSAKMYSHWALLVFPTARQALRSGR